jgi:hypothetical protein
MESFPETLRQEGGIRSYERFIKVFNSSNAKILQTLGGKVASTYGREIINCIALAKFLNNTEFTILGVDRVPEYSVFKQEEWFEYLADHSRSLTYEFRQTLNIQVTYEGNSKVEYIKARSQSGGSTTSQESNRVDPDDAVQSTPAKLDKTARSLTFGLSSPGTSKISTPGSFMQRVQNSTSAANKLTTKSLAGTSAPSQPKLQKRSVASQDISWNGKPEQFPELKEQVEGHFIQALMGHCVHQDFIASYLVHGGAVLDDFPEFGLDEEQLRSDNRVMFGALKSLFRLVQAKRHIRVQDKTQDGMRAWAAIVEEFDMGGDRSVLIEKHEAQVALKFHREYIGGITAFVRDYEDAFVELKTLNVHYNDSRCMSLLLRNLLIPDKTEWMVAHCEEKYKHDFIAACQWLRSQDARHLFSNANTSKRKAHRTTREESSPKGSIDVDHLARKHKDAVPPTEMETLNAKPTAVPDVTPMIIAPKHGSWVSDVEIADTVPTTARNTIPVATAISEDDDKPPPLLYRRRNSWSRLDEWEDMPPLEEYDNVFNHGTDSHVIAPATGELTNSTEPEIGGTKNPNTGEDSNTAGMPKFDPGGHPFKFDPGGHPVVSDDESDSPPIATPTRVGKRRSARLKKRTMRHFWLNPPQPTCYSAPPGF